MAFQRFWLSKSLYLTPPKGIFHNLIFSIALGHKLLAFAITQPLSSLLLSDISLEESQTTPPSAQCCTQVHEQSLQVHNKSRFSDFPSVISAWVYNPWGWEETLYKTWHKETDLLTRKTGATGVNTDSWYGIISKRNPSLPKYTGMTIQLRGYPSVLEL